MANCWEKCLKFLRRAKLSIFGTLLVFNLLLATYTVPLLMTSHADANDVTQGRHYTEITNQSEFIAAYLSRMRDRGNQVSSHGDDFPPENSPYLLEPGRQCDADEPFLLIAVCSATHHFELRQAIRETWATAIHKGRFYTKLVFVLGTPPSEYSHVQTAVTTESEKHKDIVQGSFIDSYANLTIKTIAALRWSEEFCSGVRYFLKSDDDIFVNIANLINLLLDQSTSSSDSMLQEIMIGHVIQNAQPIKDRYSKWYVPDSLFGDHVFPDYLSGSAYVISGNVVGRLYSYAMPRRTFWLEDVYITGMLARDLGIQLQNNSGFTIHKPSHTENSCFYNKIVTAHQLSSSELKLVWKQLHTFDSDC